MSPPSPSSPSKGNAKMTRAKHACRICNSRRVRCNVMESHPCDNCKAAGVGAQCEIIPSRRGRYPRRSKRIQPPQAQAAEAISSPTSSQNQSTQHHDPHSEPTSPSPAAGTLFFGESNFLTLVPGERADKSQPSDNGRQRQRLMFPVADTPQSQGEGSGLSAATMQYLRDEGALALPDLQTCVPALQAYFAWFHPCFPIVDRGEVMRKLASMEISRLLLQAMLFIGATYCDDETITAMGFADRSEAKNLLYGKARILWHADWEKDRMTLIQSLFLMSFWRGGPSDVRDVRYWLGVVITLAESYGLHRSEKFMSKNPNLSRMRRRIWWSIYVRERQAAASLGLPSRIRDEDCDIEALTAADLETDTDIASSSLFGSCEREHITYVIKMVEIARLLGRVIDIQFVPGQRSASADHITVLDNSLEDWKNSLPSDMQYSSDEGTATIWTCLLHLAYNHLRILIHRSRFLKSGEEDKSNQVVVNAACRISRIAEDMSAQGTLRYGQMHLITALFAALCIHALGIRRNTSMSQRIAEHRAQLCLLCLKEIQKYWRVNNNVLDLFLQYLDSSIATRLHGNAGSEAEGPSIAPVPAAIGAGLHSYGGYGGGSVAKNLGAEQQTALMSPATNFDESGMGATTSAQGGERQPVDLFEDQYLSLVNGHWEGDDALGDLSLFLRGDEFMQGEGLDFLGRSL